MNVLDSRCSVLTSLVSGLPPESTISGGRPDTKLVNTLHLESNTFILYHWIIIITRLSGYVIENSTWILYTFFV